MFEPEALRAVMTFAAALEEVFCSVNAAPVDVFATALIAVPPVFAIFNVAAPPSPPDDVALIAEPAPAVRFKALPIPVFTKLAADPASEFVMLNAVPLERLTVCVNGSVKFPPPEPPTVNVTVFPLVETPRFPAPCKLIAPLMPLTLVTRLPAKRDESIFPEPFNVKIVFALAFALPLVETVKPPTASALAARFAVNEESELPNCSFGDSSAPPSTEMPS